MQHFNTRWHNRTGIRAGRIIDLRTVAWFMLMGLFVTALAGAEPNTISTYAGGGPVAGPALSVNVAPDHIATTPNGDVYFASAGAVYKLSSGLVALIAGIPGVAGFSGDDGPAVSASLSSPGGVAVDSSGNIYIVDSNNNRIRKVSATTGVITTVAGGGSGRADNVPATSTALNYPVAIAVDGSGNIYIAEVYASEIRKVSAETGVITTVAGGGSGPYILGDNGPATSAQLNFPSDVAVDGTGNIYIADTLDHRIRKVSAETGVITTLAGGGPGADLGDGGPATSATLSAPNGVAVDGGGNVYIADTGNNRVREVSATTGVITTLAGNGNAGSSGNGGPATSASVSPRGVALDSGANIYITDGTHIRKVSAMTGVITVVAGNGYAGYSGDDGPATGASVDPGGLALDGSGNLYIADGNNNRIRKVSVETGVITTVAGDGEYSDGGYSRDNGPATNASLAFPQGVAVDLIGNIYVAETYASRIRQISAATGVITTVAGNGSVGYSGDGGPATSASLSFPYGVAVDGSGNVYIADTGDPLGPNNNNRIRKVSAETGLITTVAGNGNRGYSGDGGPATNARLASPYGLALDDAGNIYIADTANNRIRKVSVETGVITTVAGNGNGGHSGDGGPATSASLSEPRGVSVDASGNIFVADWVNNRIRKVSAATGVITTVAGNGSLGYLGDGGPATSASFAWPTGVAIDGNGNLYIADSSNHRVRKVEHAISTTTLLHSNANPTTTQNLVLTATVSPSDATGSVELFDGITSLGATALSGGVGSIFGLFLTVGTHTLTAVYSGDADYAESTSAAISQVVSARALSTVTLTSDGQPTQSNGGTVYVSILNSPATFTATVTPAQTSGSVQFFDGSMTLGTQTLSRGSAALTTSSLALGTHTITAVYSGNGLFMPRWSAPLTEQVQNAGSANDGRSSLSSR